MNAPEKLPLPEITLRERLLTASNKDGSDLRRILDERRAAKAVILRVLLQGGILEFQIPRTTHIVH